MKNTYCFLLVLILFSACLATKKQATTEQHRPQFHFTPQKGWMNDPNGMVYYKGEYHLFYQYYPDSTVWGPMHWGHAVSKDMVHWQHLPVGLLPDKLGYIFSGSAIVDEQNTSGFGKGNEPPLVAVFTYHDMAGEKAKRTDFQSQAIAYSLDKGRTWTKYADNPVIKNQGMKDFRDPKVMWHKASNQWIMILAVADHVEFYASKDLKNWAKTGEFGKTEGAHGGVWECPDLFPLKVDKTTEKWVLIVNIGNGSPNGGSGTQYFVGQFDGKTFKNDNKPDDILWFDYGRDNYAGITWSNMPDNRRVLIGWMSNWQYAQVVPTKSWRSSMTLPRELALKTTEKGVRVVQKVVKEVQALRGAKQLIWGKTGLKSIFFGDPIKLNPNSKCTELDLQFDLAKSKGDIEIIVGNSKFEHVMIGYEKSSNRFYIDRTEGGKKDFEKSFSGRHYAPRISTNNVLKLNIYLDVASVELFADDGETMMTDIFFPNEDFNQISLWSNKGAYLMEGQMWALKK